MGYSHLTDEEIMELLNDLSNEVPHKEIEKKYNIDKDSCSVLAKRYGIAQAKRQSRLKQNDRIIELYHEGYTYSDITRLIDCTVSYVTKILDKYGIQRHHTKRNVDIIKREEEIIRLYQSGNYTRQDLADKFNLSYNYICQIISRILHISNDKCIDTTITKIDDMISNGKTNKEISKELNISSKSITTRYCNQNYRKRIKERNDKIFNLYQTGHYTRKELGAMFNLANSTVSNIISEYRRK